MIVYAEAGFKLASAFSCEEQDMQENTPLVPYNSSSSRFACYLIAQNGDLKDATGLISSAKS